MIRAPVSLALWSGRRGWPKEEGARARARERGREARAREHNFKQLQPMSTMQKSLIPLARAQRSRRLAACAPASAANGAPKSHRTQRDRTDVPPLRPCHQIVRQLQSAQQLHVEVVVALAAAPDVESAAAKLDPVPSTARSARPHHCQTCRSVCRCRNVQWSCLCSAVEMCFGVCIVGAHARVLARGCVRVPRRCCRTSPATPETALALSSSTTAGRRLEQRWHHGATNSCSRAE